MKQQLLSAIACVAGLALSAQAQTSSSGSAAGPSTDPSSGSTRSSSTYPSTSAAPGSSYGGAASGQSGWTSRSLSATGRMGHEPVRGSQLTGAQITASSGGEVGTISDTIINPAGGRLEFAVISLSGNSGASSATSPSTSASSTGISSSASLGSGKQVAVPWMLLRPASSGMGSSAASSGSSSSTSAGAQQPSFVFSGDINKLQTAPGFDANTDLSQPTWRQSVFSFFGLTGSNSGTGAAETPGGVGGSSSSGSSTSGSTTPDSGSTSPQSPK